MRYLCAPTKRSEIGHEYSNRFQNQRRNRSVGHLPGSDQPGRHLGCRTGQAGEAGEKAKKQPQVPANASAQKATAPKFASAEAAGKAPSCFGEAPTLGKLTPDEGKAGDRVTITGTNFGETACLRGVSFGPGHPAQFQQTKDSITTIVPSGGKKGLVLLTITTASGENSKPFLVK